jgi:hypothetical protein
MPLLIPFPLPLLVNTGSASADLNKDSQIHADSHGDPNAETIHIEFADPLVACDLSPLIRPDSRRGNNEDDLVDSPASRRLRLGLRYSFFGAPGFTPISDLPLSAVATGCIVPGLGTITASATPAICRSPLTISAWCSVRRESSQMKGTTLSYRESDTRPQTSVTPG